MSVLLKLGWIISAFAFIYLLFLKFSDISTVIRAKGNGALRLLMSIFLAIGGSILPYYYSLQYVIPTYIYHILIIWICLLLCMLVLLAIWLYKNNVNKRSPFTATFIENKKGIDYILIYLILICIVISAWVNLYKTPEIIEIKIHSHNPKALFADNLADREAYYTITIKNNFTMPIEVFVFTLYSNQDPNLAGYVKSIKDEEVRIGRYIQSGYVNGSRNLGIKSGKVLVQSSMSETIELFKAKFGFPLLYNNPIYIAKSNFRPNRPANPETDKALNAAGIFSVRVSEEAEAKKLYWRSHVKVLADNIEFEYIVFGTIGSYPHIINDNLLISGLYLDSIIFDPIPFVDKRRRLDRVAGNILYGDYEELPMKIKGIYMEGGEFMIGGNIKKPSEKYIFGRALMPDTIWGKYYIEQMKTYNPIR